MVSCAPSAPRHRRLQRYAPTPLRRGHKQRASATCTRAMVTYINGVQAHPNTTSVDVPTTLRGAAAETGWWSSLFAASSCSRFRQRTDVRSQRSPRRCLAPRPVGRQKSTTAPPRPAIPDVRGGTCVAFFRAGPSGVPPAGARRPASLRRTRRRVGPRRCERFAFGRRFPASIGKRISGRAGFLAGRAAEAASGNQRAHPLR